jgi:hypothetical protein
MGQFYELDVGPGALPDYYDWFHNANHGDVLAYHTGDLAFDRVVLNFQHLDEQTRKNKEPLVKALNVVAARIWKDASDGLLVLVQKKINDKQYEYRAIRIRANPLMGAKGERERVPVGGS